MFTSIVTNSEAQGPQRGQQLETYGFPMFYFFVFFSVYPTTPLNQTWILIGFHNMCFSLFLQTYQADFIIFALEDAFCFLKEAARKSSVPTRPVAAGFKSLLIADGSIGIYRQLT